jgi:hypothetical protein
MIERLLAVGCGGMSIYLGYRLFLALPEIRDANGEFRLPLDIRVVFGRVGPGAFFALFGACVVALSLYASVRYEVTAGPDHSELIGAPWGFAGAPAEPGTPGVLSQTYYFGGLSEQSGSADVADRARAGARRMLERDMTALNLLESKLRSDLTDSDKAEVAGLISRVKLELLRPVWGQDWGDPAVFEGWIESGGADPPPGLKEPARLYFLGSQRRAP